MSQQGFHQNKACKIQTKHIQHKPVQYSGLPRTLLEKRLSETSVPLNF